MQLIINKRYKLEEGNTLIIGRDVKDKTELAVDLAKQAIDQGVDVHYLGFPLAISPAKYYDNPEAIIAELNNITGIMYHRLKQINEEQVYSYDQLTNKPKEMLVIIADYSSILLLADKARAEIEYEILSLYKLGKSAGISVILVDNPFNYGEFSEIASNKIGLGIPRYAYADALATLLDTSSADLEREFTNKESASRVEHSSPIEKCGFVFFPNRGEMLFMDFTEYKDEPQAAVPEIVEEAFEQKEFDLFTNDDFVEYVTKAFPEDVSNFSFANIVYPAAGSFYDTATDAKEIGNFLANHENELCQKVGQQIKKEFNV